MDKPSASRLERALLAAVLTLFFFNGVLDRLLSYYFGLRVFTTGFYALMGLAIGWRLLRIMRTGRVDVPGALAAAWLLFVSMLGSVYGDFVASVFAVKQMLLGVVFLFLFSDRSVSPSAILANLIGVLAYAVFQGTYFLTQGLTLPPWDAVYVRQLLETGAALNLYQGSIDEGGLIRPFSTFGSFSEYEIVVHIFAVSLFLMRDQLSPTRARFAMGVILLLLLQDVLLTDRTPILMALIIIGVTWAGPAIVQGGLTTSRRLVFGAAAGACIIIAPVVASPFLLASENAGVRRLGESIRFWEAESVRMRGAQEWRLATQSIRWNPEGVGPREVALQYNTHALRPHNNFWLLQIAYSYPVVWLFLAFIVAAFASLYRATISRSALVSRIGFCGLGITVAYLAASFFNVPFTGYAGVPFFLSLLWLQSEARNVQERVLSQ